MAVAVPYMVNVSSAASVQIMTFASNARGKGYTQIMTCTPLTNRLVEVLLGVVDAQVGTGEVMVNWDHLSSSCGVILDTVGVGVVLGLEDQVGSVGAIVLVAMVLVKTLRTENSSIRYVQLTHIMLATVM